MRSGHDFTRSPKLPSFGIVAVAVFAIRVLLPFSRPEYPPGAGFKNLAGAEGFEPPSPVLETGSLTVELTPLFLSSISSCERSFAPALYLTSRWSVCLRQRGQNLLNSSRSGVVFRFLVVE